MHRITGRGIVYGVFAGVLSGAAIATTRDGLLGTIVGSIGGAVVGAAFGLVNDLALALVVACGGGRRWARAAAAVTSAGCGAAGVASGAGQFRPTSLGVIAFVAWCAALGVALGPLAAFGARPARIGRAGRTLQDAASRLLVRFVVVGASIGAVVGLVLGRDRPATVLVAAVECSVFGVALSGALFALVALVRFGPQLRARR